MLSLFALPLCASSGGCGAGDYASSISASLDAVESAAVEAALLSVQFDGLDPTLTPAEAAQRSSENARRSLAPAGCVSVEVSGHVARYSVSGCTVPYSLQPLTGQFSVAFAILDGVLQACIAGANVDVGGVETDLHAWGTVEATRTSRIDCASGGAGARATDFERRGRYVASWADGCMGLEGSWTTTAADRSWTTTIRNYRQCPGLCPAAGGTLTLSGGDLGRAATLSYEGDGTAQWSAGRQSSTITLSCGG